MKLSEILLRTIISILCGGLIGLERRGKNRPAGLRTHVLVCVGAATVMMLSESLLLKYYDEFGIISDPSRLGAQVISGIGFLGAGTIIQLGANVRGLTTAASLWTVAVVGLVLGSGFYVLGFVVSAAMYIILVVFNVLARNIEKRASQGIYDLSITINNKPKVIGHVNMVLAEHNIRILDMDFNNCDKDNSEDDAITSILMTIKTDEVDISLLILELSGLNGVLSVDKL